MKKRVISAIVALAIVIPLIILGGMYFYFGIGVIGLIAFYELISAREINKKFPLLVKILAIISFVIIMLSSISSTYEFVINYRYLVLPVLCCLIPLIPYHEKDKYDIEDALFLLGCIFLLGISFNFLITIRNLGMNYFIYLMLITIMSDTFAHFFGTQIGKHKLCPSISPNKTIEGFLGGTVLATFISSIFYITMFEYNESVLLVIIISLFLSIMSALGDLVFSSIKRHYKIKDFGNIMPGHGGILDRIDSILLASLAFALVISIL